MSDYMSRDVRKPDFCICEKQRPRSASRFAVTTKLISAFVFATQIVQSLSFLNIKFQASSHFLRRHSLICVGPGRKSRRRFSDVAAHIQGSTTHDCWTSCLFSRGQNLEHPKKCCCFFKFCFGITPC